MRQQLAWQPTRMDMVCLVLGGSALPAALAELSGSVAARRKGRLRRQLVVVMARHSVTLAASADFIGRQL
jgi:hypothetical protein